MAESPDKLAVLFPGIGYTCDRPLPYYGGKLAARMGYRLIRVSYSGFPEGVKGDPVKMRQAAGMALQQSEVLLQNVPWESAGEILFLSKSIGTVVSCAYTAAHHLTVRNVLFTPVEETFQYPAGQAIAFHGTGDPWARTEVITASCRTAGIPLHLYAAANHSLETGDPEHDIRILGEVMRTVRLWLEETSG